jgi:tetraacyldisaccharide 4'-kinase
LLPRGLLREPVESLRRADVLVLSRCDQVSRAVLSRIEARLRAAACHATVLRCIHRVTSLESVDGTPLKDPIEGRRVVVFAGIAHPRAFVTTVRSLGAEMVGCRFWPDHHRYRLRDIRGLRRPGRFPRHDLLVTTEKDAVKLADMEGLDPSNIAVVRVAIDFEGDGGTLLQALLEDTLARSSSG